MHYNEGQLTTSDGLTLATKTWLPDGDMKAMVPFCHGGGEHSGRYQHVGEAFAAAGYGLHMADLRGHGKSPGKRGHMMAWEEYRSDMQAIMEEARKIAPDAKHFLAGHSLGGLITLSVAEDDPPGYQGVFTTAPFLAMAWSPPAWKLSLGRTLANVMPGLTLSTGLPLEVLTHDITFVDAYKADPLVHGMVSTRASTEIFKAQDYIMDKAHQVKLPLLILHGAQDSIASPVASQTFYDRAGSTDKTRIIYEDFYHEVCNELERESVLTDMIRWMDEHI
jgi:alpha-beta hydrolase superfamily lysophospholipase